MLDFAELFKRNGRFPETLLDIGCGLCLEGEEILERGISLTGIDQDGETMQSVQKRLPKGEFFTADAALWLGRQNCKFEAVLLRRPDLIFRTQNWHQVFQQLPAVLDRNGRAIVTTPGESEARLCEKWLRETADVVERSATGIAEEEYIMTAEHFRQEEKDKRRQNSLIQRLSWEDEQPCMVCDLRTGRCTAAADMEKTEEFTVKP